MRCTKSVCGNCWQANSTKFVESLRVYQSTFKKTLGFFIHDHACIKGSLSSHGFHEFQDLKRQSCTRMFCTMAANILQGSLYYQPKQCTIVRELPQNYNRFVLFDPPKYGYKKFNDPCIHFCFYCNFQRCCAT